MAIVSKIGNTSSSKSTSAKSNLAQVNSAIDKLRSVSTSSSAPIPANSLGVRISDQSVVNSGAGVAAHGNENLFSIPSSITSAITDKFSDSASQLTDSVKNTLTAVKDSQIGQAVLNSVNNLVSGSSGQGSSTDITPQLDYMDADIAKHYGMNAETAYVEALSNTAHQREVADMIKAGINPALAYSGSGASVNAVQQSDDSAGGTESGGLSGKGLFKLVGTAVALIAGKGKLSTAYTVNKLIDNIFKD